MIEIVVKVRVWRGVNDLIGMGVGMSDGNFNEFFFGKLDGPLSGSIAPARGLSPLLLLLVCVAVHRIILMQLKT